MGQVSRLGALIKKKVPVSDVYTVYFLSFSVETAPTDKRERKTSECRICKQQFTSTDHLFPCKNKKCTLKTHYTCEMESRKNVGKDLKKCEHCRTCKECGNVMGRANDMCQSCDSYVHAKCMQLVGAKTQETYNCKQCRQKQNI